MTFDHNRSYYDSYNPPYFTQSEIWNGHFGRAADQVIAALNPQSVIDAGCAVGVLTRQFLARGIPTIGFDSSPDAIAMCHDGDENLIGKVYLHDIATPFPHTADIVTCIEVVEHLEEKHAAAAIATLCSSALKYVVFSSTAEDVDSPQHPNVQSQAYWDALFYARNFRKTDINVQNFCPWAVVYQRKGKNPVDPEPEAVMVSVLVPNSTPVQLDDEGNIAVVEDVFSDTKKYPALQAIEPGEYLEDMVEVVTLPKRKTAKKKL